ncbi:MAG TPA: ASKHA domain-containing protein [Verrucomicrobiae bacterium]|nr:ASKHA domain-containing protein [Verrucomicrobiae bacterium]
MNAPVQIELLPLGQVLRVESGESLQDVLFDHGVEFPCGGRGRCKGCKIRVLSGALPVTPEDATCLSSAERALGWRLACRARPRGNLQIELAQWEAAILSDDSSFAFNPRPGLGVAVDLGTTTLVAQLFDLQTGRVLAVRSALNQQARHGADIMSRIEFALANNGQRVLEELVRDQIGKLIQELLSAARPDRLSPGVVRSGGSSEPVTGSIETIVLVGNTVMHHLFSGISVEPLSQYPFESTAPGLQTFPAEAIGWQLPGNPSVYFLPCLGGFVGSDLLAGILATRLRERESPALLIDLGTNGEIVLGNRERVLCAATAAGPAFEGARISMGMRAATGAISEVRLSDGRLHCHVLGNTAPRGICGSGLVDAIAAGLELGAIGKNGRLSKCQSLELAAPVSLTQRDIRELQLAKGAISAGVRLLLAHWGTTEERIKQIFLAGAFGNYINQANARRIGLLNFPAEKVVPAGNTALLGAKLALFEAPETDLTYQDLISQTTHISLNELPGFQDVYADEMSFP